VSTVAKIYMVNPLKEDGSFVGMSEPAFITTVVHWVRKYLILAQILQESTC
jgi:hypothetical protein